VAVSVHLERVAEAFEPGGVGLAGQHLGWAPALALRTFAADKAAMIEEEAEQFQTAGTDMKPQEEVVSQAAIEVFDEGTGVGRRGEDQFDGFLKTVERLTEL
jgi:hypothetical protein